MEDGVVVDIGTDGYKTLDSLPSSGLQSHKTHSKCSRDPKPTPRRSREWRPGPQGFRSKELWKADDKKEKIIEIGIPKNEKFRKC